MKESITLQELYERIVELMPSEAHSITVFKGKILGVLQEDPLRTSSTQRGIEQQGENYKIHRTFPLNDFYDGIKEYVQEVVEKDIPLRIDGFKEYVFYDDKK